MHKHVQPSENDGEDIASDYLEELDRGGLHFGPHFEVRSLRASHKPPIFKTIAKNNNN